MIINSKQSKKSIFQIEMLFLELQKMINAEKIEQEFITYRRIKKK